jgi:diketogulonate reductase-like aldo/keto reductase
MNIKKIRLSNTNEKISVIGLGTWDIENKNDQNKYKQWKSSMRKGIELGMTHIDISDSFRPTINERIIGEVIAEYDRDDLFLTGNLSPWSLRYHRMKKEVDERLKRLGIKYFDLYLIPGSNLLFPKKRYTQFLENLIDRGKTRYIGVRNFSSNQFNKAQQLLKRDEFVNIQLQASIDYPHHLHKVLPFYQKKGITVTVYSPIKNFNRIGKNFYYRNGTQQVAIAHNAKVQQISIAWVINQMNVITLLSPFHIKYLGDVAKVSDLKLDKDEINQFYNIEDDVEFEHSQWI